MSGKELMLMDGYWRALDYVTLESKRAASAGEIARHMGVARNTARKYLSRLVQTGQVVDIQAEMPNGVTATYYSVVTQFGYQYCRHQNSETIQDSDGSTFWRCLDCGEADS